MITASAFSRRWIGRAWGIWLGLFPIADFLMRPPLDRSARNFDQIRDATPALAIALVSVALGALIPALWTGIAFGVDFRRAKYLALASFLVCLSIPLSFLQHSNLQDAIYVLLVYNAFFCALVFISANVDPEEIIRGLLTALAFMHAGLLIAVLIDHDYAWGRLFGRNAPAYWGIVAQTTLIASLAMRRWVFRIGVIGMGLTVLFLTQTRGSMAAAAAGLSVVFIIYSSKSRARIWLWMSIALAVIVMIVVGSDFVAEDLFKLSDPNRGIGSGLTGRANVWREAWDLFTSHPLIGVGYRQHEHLLTSEASAHNAYLATLADTGIIGFFGYVLFLFGGAWRAVLKAVANPSGPRLAACAFLVAFLVNGMVERSALNTGNAYCQLMIIMAALAWRQDDPDNGQA